LAWLQKRMLFDILPDQFPPFLTDIERRLWWKFHKEINDGQSA